MNTSSNPSGFESSEQPEWQAMPESSSTNAALSNNGENARLQQGLAYAALSEVSADFNQPILTRLQSGTDLRSWQEQLRTRLWWMLLPCLCTIVVGTGVLQWVAGGIALPGPGETLERNENKAVHGPSSKNTSLAEAPPLPALPGVAMQPRETSLAPKQQSNAQSLDLRRDSSARRTPGQLPRKPLKAMGSKQLGHVNLRR